MNPTTHDDIPIVVHNIVDRWNSRCRYALREDVKGKIEGLRLLFNDMGILLTTENYRNGHTYGTWYTYWDTGILMEQETMSRPKRKTYFIVKRNYDDTNKYSMYPEYLTEFWEQHNPRKN
jgi:hypothetical protein